MSIFRYEEKYSAQDVIPLEIAERDVSLLEHVRESVLRKAFLEVAQKSLSENGINIKTVMHEFTRFEGYGTYLHVCVVIMLSSPIEHVIKAIEPSPSFIQVDINCIWCGARKPKHDKFHSGTCENCGGPLL